MVYSHGDERRPEGFGGWRLGFRFRGWGAQVSCPVGRCEVPRAFRGCGGWWHVVWLAFFLSFHWGEACHPGPVRQSGRFQVGAINPTGLNGKASVLSTIHPGIWGISETHLSAQGLRQFRQGLRLNQAAYRKPNFRWIHRSRLCIFISRPGIPDRVAPGCVEYRTRPIGLFLRGSFLGPRGSGLWLPGGPSQDARSSRCGH